MRSEVVRVRPQTESTMKRRIRGPQTLEAIERRAWLYELVWEPGREQRVEVRLTGTATATRDDTLPEQVAMAKRTSGRSVIDWIAGWRSLPPLIEISAEWITIHHANGYFSRIGHRLPAGPRALEALAERSRIRIPHRQKVEEIYEFTSGRWTLKSLQNNVLRREGPVKLSDVIAKIPDSQEQDARDIDPKGTSMLPRRQLTVSEARVLRSLIEEWPYDTVEQVRAELTRGRPLSYEEVEDVLDSLRTQGYVEEFGPAHWRASDYARHIKRRLLGSLIAAA
jgi:hypothetical protein